MYAHPSHHSFVSHCALHTEHMFYCMLVYLPEPWIDLILIVKNIGVPSDSCRAKLAELFPDADIVFHKDNPSEVLKG